MALTRQNLKPLLHQKNWQLMTPIVGGSAASQGSYLCADPSGTNNYVFFMSSPQLLYLYSVMEDAWMQISSNNGLFTNNPNGLKFGTCSTFLPWSIPYIANGGTTTTVTVAAASFNITGIAVGSTIEFISSGINSGLRRTVTKVLNNAGIGTITITFDLAVSTSVLNTHTFRLSTGRYYTIINYVSNLTVGVFAVFDICTQSWTSLDTSALPASNSSLDARMTSTYRIDAIFATGTATAGASSTITNSAKTWTTNQWTNYQVRIIAGTGMGQIRTVASNTGTVITVSASWTTPPDNTSVYAIEGNEDFLYFIGFNLVTMYRYSISANNWTTLSPTVARLGAPISGITLTWIGKTNNVDWGNESNIKDGRYLYSLRSNGTGNVFDQFDIAGGTAGAGAWAQLNAVTNQIYETIGIARGGTSITVIDNYFYMKMGVNANDPFNPNTRFLKWDFINNQIMPLAFNQFLEADLTGNNSHGEKMFVKNYPGTNIKWLYSLENSNNVLHRIMIF